MTANLFPTLGASPMIGRNILPEEDQLGHADEMILSYGLWTRRLMHALRGAIVGLGAGNATTIWIAVCLVLLAAAVACWIPAARATRIDPMSALRQD